MSTDTSIRTSVTLSGQNDWDEWIEIVKTKAIAGKIWEYINPDTNKTDLPTLKEPTQPKPDDINQAKITYGQLDDDEKEEYRIQQRRYKRELELYDRREATMASLRTHIQTTTTRNNLPYTFNCETTYDMLIALKKRLCPTDDVRELELINRYRKVKKPPRSQNILVWLQDYERIYTDCRKMQLPDTEGDRAVRDFLRAVSEGFSEFSSYWTNDISKAKKNSTHVPDLYEIIEQFRDHYRYMATEDRVAHHGAFNTATYQGRPQMCLCGEDHRFKDCPYLIESIRTNDWKPDPDIQKKIEEKLQNPKLKGAVERIQKQLQTQTQPQEKEDLDKINIEPIPTAF